MKLEQAVSSYEKKTEFWKKYYDAMVRGGHGGGRARARSGAAIFLNDRRKRAGKVVRAGKRGAWRGVSSDLIRSCCYYIVLLVSPVRTRGKVLYQLSIADTAALRRQVTRHSNIRWK